jgi:RNA recognition motif-containing protein
MSVKTSRPSQISKIFWNPSKKLQKSPKSVDSDSSRGSYDKSRRSNNLPIPKGETPYAMAKNAEYKHRNLDLAEHFYLQAIRTGDRVESAVKDLASLLHQRGKTKEACEILEKNRDLFKNDQEKFQNLYNTLKKQIDSSGNSQNKSLKMSCLTQDVTTEEIRSLFSNAVRIQHISLHLEEIDGKVNHFAVLSFNSHSSARKTLEGFHSWDRFKVEWISPTGEVMGDAHYARHKMEEYRKHHPTFDYVIFDRDPHGYVFSLPLDYGGYAFKTWSDDEKSAEKLLGSGLYTMIFKDDLFKNF